jgi:hypothetical protein
MISKKWFWRALGLSLVLAFTASAAAAEDISVTIRKSIQKIGKLGGNPKATDADRKKMEELYKQVIALGMNVPPVLEEVLSSKKSTVPEKKASLYIAQHLYHTDKFDEVERKGTLLMKYCKIALKDASVDVRAQALEIAIGTWCSDTYSTAKEVFRNDPDPRLRVRALWKIAGYQMDDAKKTVRDAMGDPDPSVSKAAAEYQANYDSLDAAAAARKAAEPRKKPDPDRPLGGYGKG